MKKFFSSVVLLFCCFAGMYAAGDSISSADRLLNEANLLYLDGKYSKAVEKVNTVIDVYAESGDIPENVRLMGEAAYGAWLDEILKTGNYESFTLLSQSLKLHPFRVDGQIRKRIDQIYQLKQTDIRGRQNKAAGSLNNSAWMRYNQQLLDSTKLQSELLSAINGYRTFEEIRQEQESLKAERRSYIVQAAILVVGIVFLFGVFVLIILVLVNYVKRRKTAAHFAVMMNVVALLNRDHSEKHEDRDFPVLKSPEGSCRIKEICDIGQMQDFLDLEKECSSLGSRIDRVTGRKNNSRKVSELVYKMAEKFHVSEGTALVYFCSAMVYDAGFLSIGSRIFEAEHLTVKERYRIRDHVRQAQKYFDFVPEKFLPVFLDAAVYHHENLDGSGYMDGISDREIPPVARMIHTAESYISLINRRVYHSIMDRDSAICELKRRDGIYDPRTIEILEEIV
jgi:HD-GYP domain-containing protein (c-di-GMP phosphodiesterase class II)